MADRIGQRFGDYRLTRLLGQGGFGDVYMGEHVYNHTSAAVKVLKTQLTPDKLKDFINEVRTIRLRHPNIVPILDFGIGEEELPFLVMEYAPNGTLLHRHPRGTRLPPATIIIYIEQLFAALQYAHDQRLIHRDVKPENMLFGPNNEIWLSDFGLAAVAHSTHSMRTQDAIGTWTYMAPEQIQKKPRPASDQYALAVVVYEWLCGTPPFTGDLIQLMYQHLHEPPPSLREHNSTISSAVEQVVLRALEKDPQKRFASVQEFAQALAAALAPAPQKTKGQWVGEGVAHHNAGRYKEARAAYDCAITLDPNYALAYFNRGIAYNNLKEYQKAFADFDRAIQLDSNDAGAYIARGNRYRDLKEYQKALADYDRAIQLNPKYADAYNNRGNTYHELKEYQKALADYDRAIQLNPKYAIAYSNRGNTYHELKENQKALADYDRAIQIDPNYADAYYNRGNRYRELKEYQKALADYDRAIQLNPNFANAYCNRGVTYFDLKEYQKAIADYDRAIQLDPKDDWAYAHRGQAYFSLKNYQRAIQDFDRALELNPNLSWFKNDRDEAYRQLNRKP
jgi:Tfp pilus assembly protein PilF